MDKTKMPSLDDVTIRRATPQDHDAIIRSDDVYDGKDYLAAAYPIMVNDPEVYAIVAEVKGQVVGFMMYHLLDGGMSLIGRAGRILPFYRKLGLMHKMGKTLSEYSSKHFPNVQYMYESVRENVYKRAIEDVRSGGFVEILRKPLLNLVYRTEEIIGLDAKDEPPVFISLEYDDVETLFTLDDLLEQLFPRKLLFNFFIGYRCLESNIKHILSDNKEVCVTIKTPSQTPNTTKASQLKNVDVVTFSERYMAEAGLVYIIDIYAKEGHNEASLRAHILRHLRALKELSFCGRGVLVVSIGRNVCEETVRSLLRRCGIVDRLPNSENWKVLFEKKLNSSKM